MALDMTPQEKAVGDANFKRTVGGMANSTVPGPPGGPTRRQFMQGLLAAGTVVPLTAAAYFAYTNNGFRERPVRTAFIGVGDEGGVLIGEHNPQYLEVVAFCDIRPSNYQDRVWRGEAPPSPRKGLNHHYGNDASRRIKHYTNYREMLGDRLTLGLEAVVIALPLHLHAPVAIDCMDAGLNVLCEKLMAWNVMQCKQMIRKAHEKNVVLAIGHQRHYSMLYAHANEVVNSGLLGDIHHIRALWHRNNARPLSPTDRRWNPSDPGARYMDSWREAVNPMDRAALSEESLRSYGYLPSPTHSAIEEVVRWRLYDKTGGGLMAELGSHQLDACSIFLGKVHPLAVSGVGGKYFYADDRDVDDHVFCTFEFPGKTHPRNPHRPTGTTANPNDIVVVTYSSVNTNDFEAYGECVMGTRGTLVTEKEERVMLWGTGGRSTAVSVANANTNQPALSSSGSESPAAVQATNLGAAHLSAAPSRGYREEMEHFAYVIRMREEAGTEQERNTFKPRCDGEAAMADAIMALVANRAMRTHSRIEFPAPPTPSTVASWYDYHSDDVPDGDQQPRPLPD